MSSAPKQRQTQQERTLATIANEQSQLGARIQNQVAPELVREAQKNRSAEVLGRINADFMGNMGRAPKNRADAFRTGASTNAAVRGSGDAMVEGLAGESSNRVNNTTSVIRAGQGLAGNAMGSLSQVANIANSKAINRMQNRAMVKDAALGAVGSVVGGGIYGHQQGLGIFSDDDDDSQGGRV